MKKIGIIVGILVIGLGAYIAYLFEFKEYDTEDAAVAKVAKDEYVIELADGSKIILDEFGNLVRHVVEADGTKKIEAFKDGLPHSEKSSLAVASVSSENKKNVVPPGKQEKSPASPAKSPASPAGKMTVGKVEEKYKPAISELEAQAYANLDALKDIAVNEYLEMAANDQKISYPYFYNKYTAAATELEQRTDKMFYALVDVMEQELKIHGLPVQATKAMVKEYENRKNKLRRDILKETAGL